MQSQTKAPATLNRIEVRNRQRGDVTSARECSGRTFSQVDTCPLLRVVLIPAHYLELTFSVDSFTGNKAFQLPWFATGMVSQGGIKATNSEVSFGAEVFFLHSPGIRLTLAQPGVHERRH